MKSPKVWQVALKLDEQSFLLIPGHCSVKLTDRTTYSRAISIHHVYTYTLILRVFLALIPKKPIFWLKRFYGWWK